MAEYINKDELWNERPEWRNEKMADEVKASYNKGWNDCNNEWLDKIKIMPTIDIVTCQECKHWEPYPNGCYGDCTGTDAFIYGTENWWYCPCGERKE